MFAARRCGKHRLSAKYEYKTQTIQRCDSLSRVSSVAIRLSSIEILQVFFIFTVGGSTGGDRGPDPPGKSQVVLVIIGNKQLDPTLEIVGPPLWKMWDPLWNLGK